MVLFLSHQHFKWVPLPLETIAKRDCDHYKHMVQALIFRYYGVIPSRIAIGCLCLLFQKNDFKITIECCFIWTKFLFGDKWNTWPIMYRLITSTYLPMLCNINCIICSSCIRYQYQDILRMALGDYTLVQFGFNMYLRQ